MRYFKTVKYFLALCLSTMLVASVASAAEQLPHPKTYMPHPSKVREIKRTLDDSRDLSVTYPLKDAVPPEIWDLMATDMEEAKKQTAEILGLQSPDLVGKIAPEIKPGKYSYQDLEKSPGLKELFPPMLLERIKPGGPPLIGNIPEFEIIPTRQLFWFARMCEITRQNLGKAKLDKDGYIVPRSWEGGVPFPRPSGNFKAQQVYYDFEKRPGTFERCQAFNLESMPHNRNLKRDKYTQASSASAQLMGRTLFPPYGWFDKRAERQGEFQAFSSTILLPRANRGTITLQYKYDDPDKMDPWMLYAPSIRRIRKMAATDTQDPQGDAAYDDRSHLTQKITPKKYPYEFKITAEREYLMPIAYDAGKVWVDSKNGMALKDVQFMRRPCYVLEMKQLDPNYLYSKRILYIDKENYNVCFSENYDQKGRLYRSQFMVFNYISEIGQVTLYGTPSFQFDHIDEHSTIQMQVTLPALFAREDFTIAHLIRMGK